MKKIFLFIAGLLISCFLFGQSLIKWEIGNKDNLEFGFYSFVHSDDHNHTAILTSAEKKPFAEAKHNIKIRSFSTDFKSYTDAAIPDGSPQELYFRSFGDYIVLAGSTEEDRKMPPGMLPNTISQKVMFLDKSGNVVMEQIFERTDNNSSFNGSPNISLSSDRSKLIVRSVELLTGQHDGNRDYIRILVYDEELNVVWRDSFNLQDRFGKEVGSRDVSYDFTAGNDLVMMNCLYYSTAPMKGKSVFRVMVLANSGEKKAEIKQEFADQKVYFMYKITDDGDLAVTGKTLEEVNFGSNKERLFILYMDLEGSGKNILNIWEMDKAFWSQFGKKASDMEYIFTLPERIFAMSDGIVYFVESSGMMSGKYYGKDISLMKFDFSGNIQWFKSIEKFTTTVLDKNAVGSDAYLVNDEITIFYCDNTKNVKNTKPAVIEGKRVEDFGLVIARVDKNGSISKEIISTTLATGVCPLMNSLFVIDDNRYLIEGIGTKSKAREFFAGQIEL